MTLILDAGAPRASLEADGGGKAANLARMVGLGLRVPPWFCVSARLYDAFLADNHIRPEVQRDEPPGAASARLSARILGGRLAPELAVAITDRLAADRLHDQFVAVRSSGLDEDSAQHSFAGQLSSFLYQKGPQTVLDAVLRCWASAFSERALAYRVGRDLPLSEIRVGVVIQRMVDPVAAGVAFSRNPVRPTDRDTLLVSGVWGLGEGLVSGAVDADHFEVRRDTLECKPTVAQKATAVRARAGGGVHVVGVPEADQNRPSLDEEQVREVAAMALRLEQALGAPQDIEWAFEGGALHLLQTRPITHLPPDAAFAAGVMGDGVILWDNANIIESFCGVTTPLTFSHACRGYHSVYRQFCALMGVPSQVVQAHEPMFRNMLGLVRGRIYYNLLNWYRLLALFPAFGTSGAFMETMMGLKQSLGPTLASQVELPGNPTLRHRTWRKVRLALVSLYRYARIGRLIAAFEANLDEVYRRFHRSDLTALSLPAQVELYHRLEQDILERWQAPIVNDGRCMLAFGLLKALTERWLGGGNVPAGGDVAAGGALQNDLLCGQGDVESTMPTKMLMDIAQQVDRGDPQFRAWFLATPAAQVGAELVAKRGSDPRGAGVAAAFREFLDRYGFRCVDELKLEAPDLHTDPSFAIQAIAGYLRGGTYAVAAMEEREAGIRQRAEGVVRARLRGVRRAIFFAVLRLARSAVRDRERLRFGRTKTFGLARRLVRAMGQNLVSLGRLAAVDDVFYLTVDELVAYAEGRTVTEDLGGLARKRRAEFDQFRRTPAPPDRFVTIGTVGVAAAYPPLLAGGDLLASTPSVPSDPDLLVGTPCCPGVVEGTVRIVHNVKDAEGMGGEILVTERTDPGWVPLFPTCAGLLVERGSLLSHSAVVARELGLPTIVGISGGLMTRLTSGQKVRMDASRGEIRIVR
ncbi:MAG: PEP/pyruvate-binding domain-containing protein [Bacteroidota bacterium]